MFSAGRVAASTGASSILLAVNAVVTARALGPSGRGAIALITTTATYVMLAGSLGTPISVRVLLGRPVQGALLQHYVGLGLALSLVQSILAVLVVVPVLLGSGVAIDMPLALSVAVYGSGMLAAYLLLNALYGVGAHDQAALVQILGAVAQLIPVMLLAVESFGAVWGYVLGIGIGAFGQAFVSVVLLERSGHAIRPIFFRPDWVELIWHGVPALGLTFGQAVVLRIDRILVGLFLAASAAGVYSIAATASEVVWLVPVALSQVLFHRVAAASIDASSAKWARIVSLAIAVGTAASLFVIAPFAIDRIVGPAFEGAVTPMRVLLLAAVFLASYQVDALTLAARGRIGQSAMATIVGLIVVVLADLSLIPTRGLVGAALASVFAYGVMAVCARLMASRLPGQLEASTSRIS